MRRAPALFSRSSPRERASQTRPPNTAMSIRFAPARRQPGAFAKSLLSIAIIFPH